MKSNGKAGHFVGAGALAALLVLGACDKAPEAVAVEQAKPALPPAIVPPSEVSGTPSPPSYEVGIATAAADRKHAKDLCTEKPEPERKACEEEADAAFMSAQAGLEDLRGNQQ